MRLRFDPKPLRNYCAKASDGTYRFMMGWPFRARIIENEEELRMMGQRVVRFFWLTGCGFFVFWMILGVGFGHILKGLAFGCILSVYLFALNVALSFWLVAPLRASAERCPFPTWKPTKDLDLITDMEINVEIGRYVKIVLVIFVVSVVGAASAALLVFL